MVKPEQMRGILANPVVRSILRFMARKRPGQPALLERVLVTYPERSVWYFTLFYLLIDVFRSLAGVDRKTLVKDVVGNPPVRGAIVNACRSLGYYGPTIPQVFSAPALVVWNFTNRCNLRCKHCYQDAGRGLDDELTLDEQRHVIDEMVDNGTSMVAFAGGEPLMSRTIWDALGYAKRRGMWVSVATNGTLLTKETAQRLRDTGVDYVEISLDSAVPEKHDKFRGIPGFWQRSVEGIRNAVSVPGLGVGVAPTITRRNIDELPQMIALTKELGATKLCAFNFVPTGRGRHILDDDLSPQQREQMLELLYGQLSEKQVSAYSTCPQFGRFCLEKSPDGPLATSHFSATSGKQAKMLAEYVGGCGCGRAYCAIQPNGVVTPCVFLPIPIGNLRTQSLAEIWEQSPVLTELRDRGNLKGHCGVCDYRDVCGGCRARAYGYLGDINGPDPGCKNNLKVWRELEAASRAAAQLDAVPARSALAASVVQSNPAT